MNKDAAAFDLTGKLLISTPAMGDPRFSHGVIYLCAHSAEGAFGLVVNRPVAGLGLTSVLQQLDIPLAGPVPDKPVLAGGPVETERGFVLFRDGGIDAPDSEMLPDGLSLTSSPAILAAIARGEGPSDWFLALGYAGWGAGQLESEIARNGWLTCEANDALIFAKEPGAQVWHAALRSMGIDPLSLSAVAGRA